MCYEAWAGSRCIWAGMDRLESRALHSLALRVVYFLAYEWSLLVGISCVYLTFPIRTLQVQASSSILPNTAIS
jgi:hypothetical protein